MVRRKVAATAVIVLALAGCVSEKNGTGGGATPPAAGKPAATAPAGGALSKQAMSRKFLDACVYGQARVKDIDRQSMIEKCRCASTDAMKTIGDGNMSVAKSGGFTPVQNEALKAGIAACFKPAS